MCVQKFPAYDFFYNIERMCHGGGVLCSQPCIPTYAHFSQICPGATMTNYAFTTILSELYASTVGIRCNYRIRYFVLQTISFSRLGYPTKTNNTLSSLALRGEGGAFATSDETPSNTVLYWIKLKPHVPFLRTCGKDMTNGCYVGLSLYIKCVNVRQSIRGGCFNWLAKDRRRGATRIRRVSIVCDCH